MTHIIKLHMEKCKEHCITEFAIEIEGKNIWEYVFKNRPSKICGTRPLKNLKLYDLHNLSPKDVCHRFYLVHP